MEQILEFFQKLFQAESWPPRWHCGRWTEFHGWLYICSDVAIWMAYFAIPFLLIKFVIQKRGVPLPNVFWLFGAFILLCGLTHLLDATMFWWPAYRLNGLVRFFTACVSWLTMFSLIKILPQAFALKTTKEFEVEIAARKIAEEQLHSILEAAPDAVITINKESIITNWNHQSEIIFGWKHEEAIGKTLTQIIIPERYHEEHKKGLKHFLTTGEGTILDKLMEFPGLRKDQTEFPLEFKISSTKVNGEYIFISFLRDITKRKKTDDALKESEERFKGLLESAPDAIVIAGNDGNILIANKQTEQLFGYTKDEIIGQKVELLIPQRFQKNHPEHRNKFFSEPKVRGMGIGLELFGTRKNGEEFPVEISLSPLKTSDGIIVSAAIRDITERKKAEKELKDSNERFLKIFNDNSIAMTLSQIKTNKITHANKRFYSSFGYTKEEVIGKTSEELKLVSPEEGARLLPLLLDLLKEKRSVAELQALPPEESEKLIVKLRDAMGTEGLEVVYTKKNGETFYAIISYDIIEIGNEKFTVTAYQDINERKKIEIQRNHLSIDLENKELEQFAYVASHDLQEPLRTVTNYVGLFEKQYKGKLDKNSDDYLNFITGATSRMQTLIQDLLEYSRIGRDRVIKEIDCNKLLQEVLSDLDVSIKESKADIQYEQLPTIKGYAILKSLFQNLMSNAIKFRKKDIPLINSSCY